MPAEHRRDHRQSQQPLSRRRLLQGAALSGTGLAISAIACSPAGRRRSSTSTSGGATGQAGAQPRRGGILSYAGGAAGSYDTQGRTFDPMIQTQFGSKSYTLFYQRNGLGCSVGEGLAPSRRRIRLKEHDSHGNH